jgi:hypothetical protein
MMCFTPIRLALIFVIFVSYVVLGQSTLAPSTANGCFSIKLSPTTSSQQFVYSTQYTITLNDVPATNGGSRAFQYVYFTPSVTGNYFVRVPNTLVDSIMEIRLGDCLATQSNHYAFNDDLGSTFATGFDNIALQSGQQYVILLGSFSGSSLNSGSVLNVGFCSNSCSTIPPTFNNFNSAVSASLAITIGLGVGIPVLACIGIAFIVCCILKKQRARRAEMARNQKARPPVVPGQQQQPQGYAQPQYGVPQGYMQQQPVYGQQPMMYQQQTPMAVTAPVANVVGGDDDFKGPTASLA